MHMINHESRLFIIINADDLGENKRVTQSIYEYAKRGLISSVSILANGDDFEGAKRVTLECPHISVGIHLNLSQFRSLSRASVFRERGITDENYYFTGAARYNSKVRIHFDRRLVDAIYNEWELQLEKLYDNDISVSHIDSHNHVHYRYELFFALKKLQKKFSINKIRIKDVKPIGFYGIFNKSLPRKTPSLHRELSNLIWNTLIKAVNPPAKVTDHVFSYFSLCKYLSTGSRCPQRGIFEVVVHPGSNYLDYFSEENVWVENKKLEALLPDFSLITYYDL